MPPRLPDLFVAAPYFIVDDLLSSAEFYRDTLGFHFDGLVGDAPSFVMVRRNAVTIMLKSGCPAGSVRPNRSFAPQACWDGYIWVRDAKSLYQELRAKGAPISRPLVETTYDCLEFDVLDNSGYCLCFGEHRGRAKLPGEELGCR